MLRNCPSPLHLNKSEILQQNHLLMRRRRGCKSRVDPGPGPILHSVLYALHPLLAIPDEVFPGSVRYWSFSMPSCEGRLPLFANCGFPVFLFPLSSRFSAWKK
jgi:hypothetical protein